MHYVTPGERRGGRKKRGETILKERNGRTALSLRLPREIRAKRKGTGSETRSEAGALAM